MKTPKEIRKDKHGPGGMKCPCCCEYSKAKAKALDARRVRRKLKQQDLRPSQG